MCMPFMLVDFLAVSVFESVGMGKTALVFAILRKIVFEIPAIVILNKIFQTSGITYAGFVSEFILSIIAVILLRRIADGFERREEK